jgi:hypothetical protein
MSLVVSLDTSIGTSHRYDPRVVVGRLIFLKLSLPRYGVGQCPAPCCSLLKRMDPNSLIGATPAHFLVAWQSTLWRLMVGSFVGNFLQLAYARTLGLFLEIPPSVLTQCASVFSPAKRFPVVSQLALLCFPSSRTCHVRPGDVFTRSDCVHVWFDGFPLDCQHWVYVCTLFH